jgi:hypothetical protein
MVKVLENEKDDKRINNAQRKAIAELVENEFRILTSKRADKVNDERQSIISKAQKELKFDTIKRLLDKAEREVETLKRKILDIGFDVNGTPISRESHYYGGKYVIVPSGLLIHKRLDALVRPNEDKFILTYNDIKNRIWLAGTVGEVRNILSELK